MDRLTAIENQVAIQQLDKQNIYFAADRSSFQPLSDAQDREAKLSLFGKAHNTEPEFYFWEQVKIMGRYHWQFYCALGALDFYRQLKHMYKDPSFENEWKTITQSNFEWIDVPEAYWPQLTANVLDGQSCSFWHDRLGYSFLDSKTVLITAGFGIEPIKCDVRCIEIKAPMGKLLTYATPDNQVIKITDAELKYQYKYDGRVITIPPYFLPGILNKQDTSGIVQSVHYMFPKETPKLVLVSPLNENGEPTRCMTCDLEFVIIDKATTKPKQVKKRLTKAQEMQRYYRKKKRSTRKMV